MKNIPTNLEKLRNRNILEEIKDKVIPIRETLKAPDTNNNLDYLGVADDVLNED